LQLIIIGLGGAIGAIMRYLMSNAVYAWLGRGFPWGTLSVNFLGSLLMGIFYVFFLEKMSLSVEMKSFLMIGFLGAFTTFSTFSLETVTLLQDADWLKAGMNILVSVIACVAATILGMVIARQF